MGAASTVSLMAVKKPFMLNVLNAPESLWGLSRKLIDLFGRSTVRSIVSGVSTK